MIAPSSILPPSSTLLERAADRTVAARLAALPMRVSGLWNAATCPAALLPYLAWSLSVDEWNEGWGEEKKRAVIAESRYIHQHKGTLSAIYRALSSMGQVGATVIERGNFNSYNASIPRDGSRLRAGSGGWATYRVILSQPTTINQALQIKRLLAATQRNCITLTAIDYRQSSNQHNGSILRNAVWSRGVVNTSI
jgi:phage tail P2-like protein